ncbi:TolC family outer membrane protein [Marinospirillum sp.]|uniref:TolC family outer membrane protein n=1 Tax=Marinospirillum sp. TaxID=2183934 RepID=UPI00286FEA9D|nr:TolC family outer membrane protein [Marinospirillum sp.]MDR9468681.1 TolC family outer membrane protein [Marinospirillum sp.]
MYRTNFLASMLALLLAPTLQAAGLVDVYQDAVQQDAQLAVEKARLEQARSQISQANAAILPTITAGGSWNRSKPEDGDATTTTGLSLEARQVLFSGEAWYGRSAANQSFVAAEAQYRDAEQELLLRTSEAYFAVLSAEDNLRTLQAEERAIQRQLEQVREQHEVGLIAITDVLEAQAAYDSVKAARIGAEGALMISYEDLEQITGERYDRIATLDAEMPVTQPEPNDRQAWTALALENSQALRQAEARLSAAEENLKSRRAGHWPSVEAYANYSDVLSADPEIGPQGRPLESSTTEFGLRANIEIYGGGRTSAEVREGSYALEEARYSGDLARRQILQQTRSLFTQVNTNVLTVQARQQAIRSAESALEATRSGYEVGTRNIVDVLNAERALWSAQRDYDAARYDYVVNQLRLLRAAGQLKETDLRELNHWLVSIEN